VPGEGGVSWLVCFLHQWGTLEVPLFLTEESNRDIPYQLEHHNFHTDDTDEDEEHYQEHHWGTSLSSLQM